MINVVPINLRDGTYQNKEGEKGGHLSKEEGTHTDDDIRLVYQFAHKREFGIGHI